MLLRLLTPELRRWDCCKLRASLVCKVSSRWPGLQSETLAKKKQNQPEFEVYEEKQIPEQLDSLSTDGRFSRAMKSMSSQA